MIGAPGSLRRRGSVHKNMVTKSIEDVATWYDNPAVDDLTELSRTVDDYLGMWHGELHYIALHESRLVYVNYNIKWSAIADFHLICKLAVFVGQKM